MGKTFSFGIMHISVAFLVGDDRRLAHRWRHGAGRTLREYGGVPLP